MSRRALLPFLLCFAALCGGWGIATAPLGVAAVPGCADAPDGALSGARHCPTRTLAMAEAPGADVLVGLETTNPRRVRRGTSSSFGGDRACSTCAAPAAPAVFFAVLSLSDAAPRGDLSARVRAGLSALPPPV